MIPARPNGAPEDESRSQPDRHKSSRAWPIAFAVVAVTAILVGAGLYVFRSLRDLPGDAVDKTREVLAEVESVAEAFRRGTIETTFISYATTVSGSNYLQFATVRQTEVFTRQDSASVLWGQLELPEVVVSATAPVEYTAYLDLNEAWFFELENDVLFVRAPEIRFNKPAVDVSRIEYEVRESSLFRDEDAALGKLKEGLTAMSRQRAREQLPVVRELGRRKTGEFVENWLVRSFGDGREYHVEVVFADEAAPPEGLGIGAELPPFETQ